jgi:hypothetical protein
MDAPTVAVVWSLAFAWEGGVQLTERVLLVLAFSVWCAYVCDRLLDARGLDEHGEIHSKKGLERTGLRERHFFHWRHRRFLAPLAGAAACVAGLTAVTFLPPFARERGLVLGAAALVYFSGVHAAPRLQREMRTSWPVSKELLVAVLFTAGCILPAWTRMHASGAQEFSSLWFWIPAIYFAGLAWLNCSSIARWESSDDGFDLEGRARAAHAQRLTNRPAALMVAFAGLLLAAIAGAAYSRPAALLATGAASALLLALLDRMRTRLTPLALRAAADLVLLTPLLLFLR